MPPMPWLLKKGRTLALQALLALGVLACLFWSCIPAGDATSEGPGDGSTMLGTLVFVASQLPSAATLLLLTAPFLSPAACILPASQLLVSSRQLFLGAFIYLCVVLTTSTVSMKLRVQGVTIIKPCTPTHNLTLSAISLLLVNALLGELTWEWVLVCATFGLLFGAIMIAKKVQACKAGRTMSHDAAGAQISLSHCDDESPFALEVFVSPPLTLRLIATALLPSVKWISILRVLFRALKAAAADPVVHQRSRALLSHFWSARKFRVLIAAFEKMFHTKALEHLPFSAMSYLGALHWARLAILLGDAAGATVQVGNETYSRQYCLVMALECNEEFPCWKLLGRTLPDRYATVRVNGVLYSAAACFAQELECNGDDFEAWATLGLTLIPDPRAGFVTVHQKKFNAKKCVLRALQIASSAEHTLHLPNSLSLTLRTHGETLDDEGQGGHRHQHVVHALWAKLADCLELEKERDPVLAAAVVSPLRTQEEEDTDTDADSDVAIINHIHYTPLLCYLEMIHLCPGHGPTWEKLAKKLDADAGEGITIGGMTLTVQDCHERAARYSRDAAVLAASPSDVRAAAKG